MVDKKTLIICVSIHHGNTFKIAEVIGKELDAKIIKPSDIEKENIFDYDLVGFGSGIYNQKHHVSLFNLIEKLPPQNNRKTFIFSTNTFGLKTLHKPFNIKIIEKGFNIIGEFTCPGFIDYEFVKYFFGGLSKNRPNKNDLIAARDFAKEMRERIK